MKKSDHIADAQEHLSAAIDAITSGGVYNHQENVVEDTVARMRGEWHTLDKLREHFLHVEKAAATPTLNVP